MVILFLALLIGEAVKADYQCVCNYNIEKGVFPTVRCLRNNGNNSLLLLCYSWCWCPCHGSGAHVCDILFVISCCFITMYVHNAKTNHFLHLKPFYDWKVYKLEYAILVYIIPREHPNQIRSENCRLESIDQTVKLSFYSIYSITVHDRKRSRFWRSRTYYLTVT